MTKTLNVLETLERNFLARHYRPDAVFGPLKEFVTLVQQATDQAQAVGQDPMLSPEGRFTERKAALDAMAQQISQRRDSRLAGLDADLAAQRTALAPAAKPADPKKVDHLLSVLRTMTPDEVAICYGSASDDEKLLMEAASSLIGRVPTKTREKGIVWTPLLDPDAVTATAMARAEAAQPAAAERLRELAEVRAMTASVANCALADLKEMANRQI